MELAIIAGSFLTPVGPAPAVLFFEDHTILGTLEEATDSNLIDTQNRVFAFGRSIPLLLCPSAAPEAGAAAAAAEVETEAAEVTQIDPGSEVLPALCQTPDRHHLAREGQGERRTPDRRSLRQVPGRWPEALTDAAPQVRGTASARRAHRAIATAWYPVTVGSCGMSASKSVRPPNASISCASGGVTMLVTTFPDRSSASTRIESPRTLRSPALTIVPTTRSLRRIGGRLVVQVHDRDVDHLRRRGRVLLDDRSRRDDALMVRSAGGHPPAIHPARAASPAPAPNHTEESIFMIRSSRGQFRKGVPPAGLRNSSRRSRPVV